VTIFPLADLTRRLVGDAARVVTLVPPGASPHTFELTPEAMRAVGQAALVVRVGPGVDEWLEKLWSGRRGPVFEAMAATTLLAGNPEQGHDAHDDAGHALDKDPHVWLDPVRVRDDLVPQLATRLAAVLPGSAVLANAERLRAELAELDRALAAQLGALAHRRYVGAHPAWRYFNARYRLEMVACVEPVGGTEPSARWLREVVATARRSGARCVFTEAQLSDKLVRTVAEEAGLRVGVLDPLGGDGLPGRDSYATLLRHNAAQFAEGLR
jgi:ABC-type Zn uptake system ZnuABC Zn-binding protein ZnuA